jgi:hypothetical protein
MTTRILYISGQTVSLYVIRRKLIEEVGRHSCDDAGYGAICRLLQEDGAAPVSILVDLIEEEFREETLPHTTGRDRHALHARHAGKLFRTTSYRHYRVVDRLKEGRRDDRVLFSALTNRDNIEPLLAMLSAAEIPVKGIYSLPLLTRHLIKPLSAETGNVLIVTKQPDSGLRETFVRNGQVHFSRLAPISENSPADYPRILSAEARKTRRYLHTLRLLPHDQPLSVYALCDSQRLEALKASLDENSDISIQGINIMQLAQLLGLENFPDTCLSDTLFCYLLHRHRSTNHYARGQDLRNWRTHLLRQGLRAATWLIAVGAVTLSGMNVVDSRLIARESNELKLASTQITSNYQRVRQGLPVTPETAMAMREAISVADRLGAYPVDLGRLFRLVGDGFSAQPGLAMDRFDWFVAAEPGAEKPAVLQQTADEAVSLGDAPYLISRIKGHVGDFNGNYAQAQRMIASLAGQLSGQDGVLMAEVVRKPLNTRADNNLQGGMSVNGDRELAEFELRIVLELGREPV